VVIGGILGGVLGSQVGHGGGTTAAIIVGILLGGAIGGAVGRSMGAMDRLKTAHSIETVRTDRCAIQLEKTGFRERLYSGTDKNDRNYQRVHAGNIRLTPSSPVSWNRFMARPVDRQLAAGKHNSHGTTFSTDRIELIECLLNLFIEILPLLSVDRHEKCHSSACL
jgi:hypothetical protein